ncbi:trypsin domain-containing protein [Phthorimaea operculella]|nr:trypsin domain-containing protein [Phthorimaea operculella]
MLKSLVALSLLSVAFGHPKILRVDPEGSPVISRNYHETVGIPRAAYIKAAEEAITFDGSKIVGGSPADLGFYPYFGGLLISLDNGQTSVCGSSLLSNTKLVTAAHCWWDGTHQGTQMVVVLGSTTLFQGGTRHQTNQVVVHQGWNPTTYVNDLAMITVPWTGFSNIITNINLAVNPNNQGYVGQYVWAAGFGAQFDGNLPIPAGQTLHHVQLLIVENSVCAGYFPGSIFDSHVCVDGSNGRSTCFGDSGGPLTFGNFLVGVTSFGNVNGCEVGWPAVFSRVTFFMDWIYSNM